jgi:hypothetical protein
MPQGFIDSMQQGVFLFTFKDAYTPTRDIERQMNVPLDHAAVLTCINGFI